MKKILTPAMLLVALTLGTTSLSIRGRTPQQGLSGTRPKKQHIWHFLVHLKKKLFAPFYWKPPQPIKQPRWNNELDQELIEYHLKNDPIAFVINLDTFFGRHIWSSHYLRMVILESGLIALFKSSYKKNIARFRLRHYSANFHYGEVAAYRLSKTLGLRLVPPTVFRTVEGLPGSLQFYITALHDAVFHSRRDVAKHLPFIDDETRSTETLFCYIAGQWDNYCGNKLIAQYDGQYRLVLIDNAGMCLRTQSQYGGPIFVEQGHKNCVASSCIDEKFPFDKAQTVPGNYETMFSFFGPYLRKKHIRELSTRPELTIATWHHTLWLHYKNSKEVSAFYKPFITALSKLTRQDLEQVWAELLAVDPERAHDLIQSTLDRKDEIMDKALTSGRIQQ